MVVGMAVGWLADHRATAKQTEPMKYVLLDSKAAIEALATYEGFQGSATYFMPDFDSVLGPGARREEFKPQDRR